MSGPLRSITLYVLRRKGERNVSVKISVKDVKFVYACMSVCVCVCVVIVISHSESMRHTEDVVWTLEGYLYSQDRCV